jgi:hypothetical protein
MDFTSFYSDRPVHDVAAERLHEWYDNLMQKNQQADVTKVGPHGYVHGWIKVGTGTDEHGNSVLGQAPTGAVRGPKGSSWVGLDKTGKAAKSRGDVVAAMNTESGNIHSMRPGDTLRHIGSSSQQEGTGFVSQSAFGVRNQRHATREQGAARVVRTWQKLTGDPSKSNGYGVEMTSKKREQMKSALVNEFGDDAKPMTAALDKVPNGKIYPTMSEDERDKFLSSHEETDMPAPDQVVGLHNYLYGN